MLRSVSRRVGLAALAASGLSNSPARCHDDSASSRSSLWVAGGVAAGVAVGGVAWALLRGGNNESLVDWTQRWAGYKSAGIQPGFHRSEVNPNLIEHFQSFLGSRKVSRSILVPLAGKTVDLEYLAENGHQVLAVEFVPQAIEEYVQENPARQLQHSGYAGQYKLYQSPEYVPASSVAGMPKGRCFKNDSNGVGFYRDDGQGQIRFAVGDVFDLESGGFGKMEACWDRGAFVALSEADRARYGQLMARVIQPGGRILLMGLEHPPLKGGKLGPPYSTSPEEVARVFGAAFEIRELKRTDVNDSEGWKKRQGTEYFNEVAYLLQRKVEH